MKNSQYVFPKGTSHQFQYQLRGFYRESRFIKAVIVTQRQNQLTHCNGHAKLVENIGIFNSNIHNNQICDLHLLADTVADDIIRCRVGIGAEDIYPFYLLPLLAGMVERTDHRICLFIDVQFGGQGSDEILQTPFIHHIRHVREIHDNECVDFVFLVELYALLVDVQLLGTMFTGHKTAAGLNAVFR